MYLKRLRITDLEQHFNEFSYGKASWAPEVRFPVRQTIAGVIDAISRYVHGDHSANVSYKYEGVLKVIRRSRATLIFAMGVLIV